MRRTPFPVGMLKILKKIRAHISQIRLRLTFLKTKIFWSFLGKEDRKVDEGIDHIIDKFMDEKKQVTYQIDTSDVGQLGLVSFN